MTLEEICRFKIFLPNKYTKFKYIQIKLESEFDRCHSMWYILNSNHGWYTFLLCTFEYMRSFLFVNKSTNFCFYCIDAVWTFISIRFKNFATFSASMLIIDDNSPTSFSVLESIEPIFFLHCVQATLIFNVRFDAVVANLLIIEDCPCL